MPLLKREIDFHPPDLFDLPLDRHPWVVLHVRSRQEKVVARHLLREGTPFYLPQMQRETRRSGRRFLSHLPLFAGYIFARAEAGRPSAYFHDAVVRAIPVEDQRRLHEELAQIHRLQESGARLVPYAEVTVGDAVRITEGIFKGYVGVVTRERGQLRLVVSVTMLHQSVAVELEKDAVTPAVR